MKNKLLVVIALLMLSIAAYAYTSSTSSTTAMASCCCCKGDSCPMKKDRNAEKEKSDKASCCDKCKGDSCPMHKDGEHAGGSQPDGHASDCSCSCCKDKKKDGTV